MKDEGESDFIERLPKGTKGEEFASRPVVGVTKGKSPSKKKGLLSWFQEGTNNSNQGPPTTPSTSKKSSPVVGGSLLKRRNAAIKVEPKIFFSNERTFLAWLHTSVLLAGASIAFSSFTQQSSYYNQIYGVILLPVAIMFIVYSMYQYAKRCEMISRRAPGPYEDLIGPTVFGIVLMLSIVTQFSLKLYDILY
jgi:uncharacterized membrane protein YidH (DUF202 family)